MTGWYNFIAIPILVLAVSWSQGTPLPKNTKNKHIAQNIHRYRAATNPETRAALLKELAPSRDPRAAVVLGEALKDPVLALRVIATNCLLDYYVPALVEGGSEQQMEAALRWWKKNEARLRREAKQMDRR
jgi:hypothetical protein